MDWKQEIGRWGRRLFGWLVQVPIGKWLAILLGLAIVYLLWRLAVRRRRPPGRLEPLLAIDVAKLGDAGPPAEPPYLEYHHVRVRLAVLVLAPAGRNRVLPPAEELGAVLEAIVPGLASVVAAHKPVLHRWPAQLSTHGFAHKFFANVKLPGDQGRGTPWCSAAGVFRFRGQVTLAGLLMRAGSAVHFGQRKIDEEGKWLDVLRVQEEDRR